MLLCAIHGGVKFFLAHMRDVGLHVHADLGDIPDLFCLRRYGSALVSIASAVMPSSASSAASVRDMQAASAATSISLGVVQGIS